MAGMNNDNDIADALPQDVWTVLEQDADAVLVDCRTSQEWSSIGYPDLGKIGKSVLKIEWKQAPDMRLNPHFAEELDRALDGKTPSKLFFICRSGARSREAATLIKGRQSSSAEGPECINVAEGFEGKPTAPAPCGWQARGLPSKRG